MKRFLLILLFIPSLAIAATITGTVYDLDLEPAQAVMTINTSPEQRIVAKDGTYSFTVPNGQYALNAAIIDDGEWSARENLTVSQDGTYMVDLILVPSFEEVDELTLEEGYIPSLDSGDRAWIWLISALLAILAAGLYLHTRKSPLRDDDDEFKTAVLEALKKRGGRSTQKQIRKEVPFSEAKVSLVITELEDEGRIRKIKKGRGNVIVIE